MGAPLLEFATVESADDEMEHAIHAKLFYVSGIVQGVGYRFYAQRVAVRLGLCGYAKNLRDGRVEVYAIGPAERVSTFRLALEKGPSAASVTDVIESEAELEDGYAHGFSIEHDTW
jgi:acylphosphatase